MRLELPQLEKATAKVIRRERAHQDEVWAKNDAERIHNLRSLDRAAQFLDIGAASQEDG
jgi:hypothetical protein